MPVTVHYRMIGQNISCHRKKCKLTQEQLAEKAGICQQFLSCLERGKGIPSVQTILSLCDAMHLTPDNLLTGSATHNDDAPCRLRSDGSVFMHTLSDQLITEVDAAPIIVRLEDLPECDIELPDL